MKTQFLVLIILFCITACGQQEEDANINMEIDNEVYKTYQKVSYSDLPNEIKLMMKENDCGEINAYPSEENDYETNYDTGYIIDLNEDGKAEYIFSCLAPMHGPAYGNIYSLLNGKWEEIGGMSVFDTDEPEMAISVLKSKNEGYHDLLFDGYNNRKVVRRFFTNEYYYIHYPDEILENLTFYFKQPDKAYFGISNNAKEEINKITNKKTDNYKIHYFALGTNKEVQRTKKILMEKGFNFIERYNTGKVLFCYTKE